MIPHAFEAFHVAMPIQTPSTTLRMTANVIGLVLMIVGVALLYRWGHDHRSAITMRWFVLPAAVTIAGAVLVAIGATLALVPSPGVSAVDDVGNSPARTSPATASPPVAPPFSADSDTSTTSTRPAVAGAPAERRKGFIALTDGYAVDLDSRDGDWNIEQAKYVFFGENLDLRLFTLLDVHFSIVKVTPTAGYFDCANSTGRQTEIAHDNFSEGDAFCVETNESRWARVIITAKETDGTYSTRVEMDVVVWEKRVF